VTHIYLTNHRATNAPLPHAKRPPPGGYVQTGLWEVRAVCAAFSLTNFFLG
jgi:hypothetical protein